MHILRPPSCLKTIRRDNRSIQALSLPTVLNYNMRSFFPKFQSFCDDMDEREADIAFLSEVWEKKENKKHKKKLETMFEMRGIEYISTPRPGRKRGGGAAVAVSTQHFHLTKLNISIPTSVEVVWGLLKPKNPTGPITTIIVCCFYSPPNSRRKKCFT